MKTFGAVKSSGCAAITERRNCRRAVFALTLIALAAIGRAARADEGADLSIDDAWVVGLRFELSQEKSWPRFAQRATPPDPQVARAGE
jgi:hypothetical protein